MDIETQINIVGIFNIIYMKKNICPDCKRRFESIHNLQWCRECRKQRGIYKSDEQKKRDARKIWKNKKIDVNYWKGDIKLLYIKKNNDLLNQLDTFRIANIYMDVVASEVTYSTLEPLEQAKRMITELWNLLNNPYFSDFKHKTGRPKGSKNKAKI